MLERDILSDREREVEISGTRGAFESDISKEHAMCVKPMFLSHYIVNNLF